MIALDLDGTLADYGYSPAVVYVNTVLVSILAARRVRKVAILTNQGGLPFGILGKLRKDGRPYPTPDLFLLRLGCVITALSHQHIQVAALRVSIHHPYADAHAIQRAAQAVREGVRPLVIDWRVYTTAAARKPQPLMLNSVGATEYYGDSAEDAEAALAAGVPFVRVERFHGP